MNTAAHKNYGLDLEREKQERSQEDWVFGASTPQRCMALIPQKDREKYLPKGEVQRGKEDYQDCATRWIINAVEAKFTYLYQHDLLSPQDQDWLEDNGYIQKDRVLFSDRFNAIKSGTTRTGNSLKAPLQSVHSDGLIPKSILSAQKKLTWAEYHDPKSITNEMVSLGKEFNTRFSINYERVYLMHFPTVIEEDMIGVGGYAWPFPSKDGTYPKDLRDPNHAFLYFAAPRYHIFDNYVDTFDGDFIKRLSPDYALMEYGYRIFISKPEDSAEVEINSLLLQVLDLCKQLLDKLKKQIGSLANGSLWK